MLVLSRKFNESIVITENILITVLQVRNQVVRLRIEVPEHVSVFRSEVFDSPRSRISGGGDGQASSAALLSARLGVSNPSRSDRRSARYTGWQVIYTTTDVNNAFVQRILVELRRRFPGLGAFAEYDPYEQTLEVIPPEDTDFAESSQMRDEIEALLITIYDRMRCQGGGE